MKLFKNKDGDFKKYVEFKYEVGEPVEVYYDGEWEIYEVCEHDDGTIVLEPFGYDLNLNYIYDLQRYKLRQTRQTFSLARKIYEEEIQERKKIIDHQREKDEIEEINHLLLNLQSPKTPQEKL